MGFSRETALAVGLLIFNGAGLYLVVRSFWPRGRTRRGGRIASLIAGFLVIGVVLWIGPEVVFDAFRGQVPDNEGVIAVMVIVSSLLVGVALGDYVFARVIPGLGRLVTSTESRNQAVVSLLTIVAGLGLAGAAWAGARLIDPDVGSVVGDSGNLTVELVGEFDLPDEPRDLVFTGSSTGYISFPTSIAYFEVTGSGEDYRLDLTHVVDSAGIDNPRGLSIADRYLFASEQGQPEDDAPQGMYSTSGQVVRFEIADDGTLHDRTVIVEQVPVVSVLHGINGQAVGPDGMVYVSIGGAIRELTPEPPNFEWLGTVLRFDVDGAGPEVYASGLRNVYDLEWDEQGRLWGVDNDGPTFRGYRGEEILQIKEGENYGYPHEGTFVAHQVRTDGPVWAHTGPDVEGTAGIELSQNLGLETGILIGARSLTFLPYFEDDNGIYAGTDFDIQGLEVLFDRQGYFTIVEASDNELLYVGVTGLSLQSNLYLLQVGR